jgi:hypothetical protein
MAEDVEHPPEPGRDPATDVVVGDHEVLVADPGCAEAVGERGGRGEWMAARRAEPVVVGEASSRSRWIAPGRWPAAQAARVAAA